MKLTAQQIVALNYVASNKETVLPNNSGSFKALEARGLIVGSNDSRGFYQMTLTDAGKHMIVKLELTDKIKAAKTPKEGWDLMREAHKARKALGLSK
jgi:hypothetical protein